MSESVDLVKQVRDDLALWQSASVDNPQMQSVVQRFQSNINVLDLALERIVELARLTSALPPDLGNIYDLPAELREELSVAKTDELEDQIVTVINAYEGKEASLDQILVGLYRKFSVSQKRRFMQNKLYRMPMIWSVDGKKGVYTTVKPENYADNTQEDTEDDDVFFNSSDLESEIPF